MYFFLFDLLLYGIPLLMQYLVVTEGGVSLTTHTGWGMVVLVLSTTDYREVPQREVPSGYQLPSTKQGPVWTGTPSGGGHSSVTTPRVTSP